jgi:ankyrin repeat protein
MRTLALALCICVAAVRADLDALIAAARSDDLHAVKMELKRGTDINGIARDGSGQSPLMAATLAGATQVVKHLLKKGADFTVPEKDGYADVRLLKVVVARLTFGRFPCFRYTPMHGACFQGRPEVARLLIKAGMGANDYHRDGFSPIFRCSWGARPGHVAAMEVLLDEGKVDPNVQTKSGHMTLLQAVLQKKGSAGSDEMLAALLKRGASMSGLTSEEKAHCKTVLAKLEL